MGDEREVAAKQLSYRIDIKTDTGYFSNISIQSNNSADTKDTATPITGFDAISDIIGSTNSSTLCSQTCQKKPDHNVSSCGTDTTGTGSCHIPANFIKTIQAIQFVCHQVLSSVENVIKSWQTYQKQHKLLLPCSQQNCSIKWKPKPSHSCRECIKWTKALEKVYYPQEAKGSICWRNINPTLLHCNPTEVANAFAIHVPQGQRPVKFSDYDTASLLKVITGFGEFHRNNAPAGKYSDPYSILQKVVDIRNTLSHFPLDKKLHIGDLELLDYFNAIKDMVLCLEELHHIPSAQDLNLKLDKILHTNVTTTTDKMQHLLKTEFQTFQENLEKKQQDLENKLTDKVDKLVLGMEEIKSNVDDIQLKTEPENRTAYQATNQTIIHGDVYNVSGDLIISEAGQTYRNKQVSDQALTQSIADDLKEYYLNNLCKKPLYPWDTNRFVDLDSIYVPVTIDIDLPGIRHTIKQRVQFYHDLFKDDKTSTRYSLSADPGQGKSSFCAKLAYDWSTGAALQNIKLLVILQLGLMNHCSNVEEEIRSQLLSINVDSETLERILQDSGKSLLLVLDGLDEAPPDLLKHDCVGSVVKTIRHNRFRHCRILITTRPWRLHELIKIPSFKRLELQKMSKSDVKEFVRKFFNIDQVDLIAINLGLRLEKYIEENRLLVDTSTPLVVLLICWYWVETEGHQGIPDRIGELYRRLFQILFQKGQQEMQTDDTQTQDFFSRVTSMLRRNDRRVSKEEITEILGRMGVQGLTPTKTQIVFTEDEAKKLCGERIFDQCRHTGIICKKGKKFIQFFHKSGQEYCAGVYLSTHPNKLAHYLQSVNTIDKALSLAPVLTFACTSKQSTRVILESLMKLFRSHILIHDYYKERLSFDQMRQIQQFIVLCLECNFEADSNKEFIAVLSELFPNGNVLFNGISSKASISLAYFMSHCNPDNINSIKLQPIAHSSHPFINRGPIFDTYSSTLKAMKAIPMENIEQLHNKLHAVNPDLHRQWEHSNARFSDFIAYMSCIQACEGLPPCSEVQLEPVINSVKHINLEVLNINNLPLHDEFDSIVESVANGDMHALQQLHARAAMSTANQLTKLVNNLPKMPLLKAIDISWNKTEMGQSLPILTSNLAKCKELTRLQLVALHAPAADMLVLAQNLPSQLTQLGIIENEMDDDVASCLIATLPQSLTHLYISVNELSQSKHNELLTVIHGRLLGLQCLRLCQSPFAADLVTHGGRALAMCKDMYELVMLTTCHDTVPDDCLEDFLNGLRHAQSISTLKMYGIRLSMDGFQKLIELCRQKGLKQLRFNRSDLPKDVQLLQLDDFIILM